MSLIIAYKMSALWEQLQRSETVFEHNIACVIVKGFERSIGISPNEMDSVEWSSFISTLQVLEEQCAADPDGEIPLINWRTALHCKWKPYILLMSTSPKKWEETFASVCNGSTTITKLLQLNGHTKPEFTPQQTLRNIADLCSLISGQWVRGPCPNHDSCRSSFGRPSQACFLNHYHIDDTQVYEYDHPLDISTQLVIDRFME
jgi:hypothetical protein